MKAMTLSTLSREDFNSYENGKIIAGIQWAVKTDLGLETHETYQFDSLEDVTSTALSFQRNVPGMKSVKIVTHKGEYKGMKTLYEWTATE